MEPAKFVPLNTSSAPTVLLTITDRAALELKNAMAQQTGGQYVGLRLGVEAGGCCGVGYSLAFAKTSQPDDVVVENQGVKVFVNKDDSDALRGAKVDFVDTPMGSGFHIDNPNQMAGGGHGHEQGHGHEHGGGGCGCGNGGGGCGCGHGAGGEGCGC